MTDHTHFALHSEKNAPCGEFFPHDGSIHVNLDEITEMIDEDALCNFEECLIASIKDIIEHEETHKAISESTLETDTFNEQDERIFMVIRDWLYRNKMTTITSYD